ncbi:MAG: TetR/AcrR family transcriptional regulator [Methylocystaceae bacterium]
MATRNGNKRDLIINSAKSVFSSKGYHNTTIEEIAIQAGVGKGTVYEYFDSKLALFQGMLGEILSQYFNSLEVPPRNLTFEKRIYHMIASHLEFSHANPELTRFVFLEGEIIDQELKDWGNQMRKEKEAVLANIVTDATTNGELRSVEPKLVATLITGLLASMTYPIATGEWEPDINDITEKMTDIIMHGISKNN